MYRNEQLERLGLMFIGTSIGLFFAALLVSIGLPLWGLMPLCLVNMLIAFVLFAKST